MWISDWCQLYVLSLWVTQIIQTHTPLKWRSHTPKTEGFHQKPILDQSVEIIGLKVGATLHVLKEPPFSVVQWNPTSKMTELQKDQNVDLNI